MDDVVRLHEDKPVVYFDGDLVAAVFLSRHHSYQAVELARERLPLRATLARPRHGGLQPYRVDRFQHVIHGIDFKRLDRALVKRGDENHAGSGSGFHQAAGDFEAREARHLHVEEGDVRDVARDFVECFDAVGRLADHFHAVDLPEQEAQLVSRELLIIRDDRRQVGA